VDRSTGFCLSKPPSPPITRHYLGIILVSAAADLVFIIAGRVNVIVIKAGPVVAPVCARITNRPGAMAVFTIFRARIGPTLADCGTGLITPTKFP